MTAPRPFNSHEIANLVRSGKVVAIGANIRMYAQRDVLACGCLRCKIELHCAHADLTIKADEIAAFVMKHQHTEKSS